MTRCKYLDDLGLEQCEYGTNFVSDNDKRSARWQEQRELYGFDDREVWDLRCMFIEWVYTTIIQEESTKLYGVFFGERLAYVIQVPTEDFFKDVLERNMAPVDEITKYIRKNREFSKE